jgi:plastocyanin
MGGSFHEVETTGAEVKVRFLYDNEYIYTLVQYPDLTQSIANLNMWLWDGTEWYTLESELENLPEPWYEDDMMGIMWNINVPEFEERGCATKCHVIWKGDEVQIPFDMLPGENTLHIEGSCRSCHDANELEFTAAGGYVETEGQYLDMWMERTNRVLPLGFTDDWFWTKPRAGYPHGGRNSDEGSALYYNNRSRTAMVPIYMETNPTDYFDAMMLKKSEIAMGEAVLVENLTADQISEYWANYQALKVPVPTEYPKALVPQRVLDDFAVGMMPSVQLLGSRWNVISAGEWENGIWTFEFARKLVTGHPDDIQFDDFTKTFSFSIAISSAGGEYLSYHVGTPPHLVFAHPGEEAAPPEEVAPPDEVALSSIRITVDEGEMELSGDDLTPYGSGLSSPQASPWTMTIEKGATISINTGTGYYVQVDHTVTIEGTTLDVYLTPQTKKGPFEVTFNEVGTFKVYCKLHPDEHGETLIVVTEEGVALPPETPPSAPMALPPIQLKLANEYIQLSGDDLTPYGSGLSSPLNSRDGPWTITVKKDSTISITEVSMSGNPATLDHNLAIEGTTLDVYLAHGETAGPFEVTFNEVGTFKIYCKLHPDEHGETLIVVEE